MARSFSTGNRLDGGDYLHTPTIPFFTAGWVYSTTSPAVASPWGRARTAADQGGWSFKSRQWNNTGNIGYSEVGVADLNSTIAMDNDVWLWIGVSVRASTSRFYKMTAAGVLTAANVTHTSAIISGSSQGFAIGAGNDGGLDPFTGRVAWVVAITNYQPTDNAVKALAYRPWSARTYAGSVYRLWPVIGTSPEPEWSGAVTNLTVTGSPAIADGPPVGPMGFDYGFTPTSAAAAVSIPPIRRAIIV